LILDSFVESDQLKSTPPVCVDGRHGPADPGTTDEIYPQALGGSLLIGTIYSMYSPNGRFLNQLIEVINSLKEAGYPAGVHRGSHRTDDASDCGFADNLAKILSRLAENSSEITDIIDQAAPNVVNAEVWIKVVQDAKELAEKIDVNGETIVSTVAQETSAQVQTLEADHGELAALVNLVPNSTLDTKSLVSSGNQAFNLDLWFVLQQASVIEIDQDYATLASLGLYVATEMVLVEDKKQYRLPVIIKS